MEQQYYNRYNELIINEIKYIYSLINKKPLKELLNIICENRIKIQELLQLEFNNKLKQIFNKNKIKIENTNISYNINNLYDTIINNKIDNINTIQELLQLCINSDLYTEYNEDIFIILINSIILYTNNSNKYFIYLKKMNININNYLYLKNNFKLLFDMIFNKYEITNINYSFEINIFEKEPNNDIIMNNFYNSINNLKLNELNNEF